MSVGKNVSSRSGVGECRGEAIEVPKLEGRPSTDEVIAAYVRFVGASSIDFPDEDYCYSILPIRDHHRRASAEEPFDAWFLALSIVNEFTFYEGAGNDLDPRNPFSKFWVNNKSVQSAEEVAAAFQNLAANARQGLDRSCCKPC